MESLNNLYEGILSGDLNRTVVAVQEAIDANVAPELIINNSMIKAMSEVGRRFEAGEAFVPELLMAARAMKGALDLLNPLMQGENSISLGKVVIGTVKGDLHDIGKNLVASMLEGCGFEVINLGVDVSDEQFVAAVKEHNAQIVCMSALLTTTMTYMKQVIAAIDAAGLRDKVSIMIGGAPISDNYSEEIGADGFSSNANSAVAKARELMEV